MKQRIVKRLFFWSLVYIEVVSQPSQNELEASNFPTFSNIVYYLLPTRHLGLITLNNSRTSIAACYYGCPAYHC